MYQRPFTNPPDGDEAINLAEDRTLKGHGKRGHGLHGKDADLAGGQVWVKEAWWFPGGVDAYVSAYATEQHEDCEACEWGDCDGIELSSGDIYVHADTDTEDEDEAIRVLYEAIERDPGVRSICTNCDFVEEVTHAE